MCFSITGRSFAARYACKCSGIDGNAIRRVIQGSWKGVRYMWYLGFYNKSKLTYCSFLTEKKRQKIDHGYLFQNALSMFYYIYVSENTTDNDNLT